MALAKLRPFAHANITNSVGFLMIQATKVNAITTESLKTTLRQAALQASVEAQTRACAPFGSARVVSAQESALSPQP